MAREDTVMSAMRESAYRAENPRGGNLNVICMCAIRQALTRQATAIGMEVYCLHTLQSYIAEPRMSTVITNHKVDAFVGGIGLQVFTEFSSAQTLPLTYFDRSMKFRRTTFNKLRIHSELSKK